MFILWFVYFANFLGGTNVTRLLGDLIKKKYKLDLPHSILERIKLDLCMFSLLSLALLTG
jgi:hypothetical protein